MRFRQDGKKLGHYECIPSHPLAPNLWGKSLRICPYSLIRFSGPGMQQQSIGALEMTRSSFDIATRHVKTIVGFTYILSASDQKHLHHEDTINPHIGRLIAMPELPIRAWIRLNCFQNLQCGFLIALVASARIECAECRPGHKIVKISQCASLIIAFVINKVINILLHVGCIFWIIE